MASTAGPYVMFSFVFSSVGVVSPHCASDAPSSPVSFIDDRPAKRRPVFLAEFVCMNCGVTSTPQARAGPAGPATLCNRCVTLCPLGLSSYLPLRIPKPDLTCMPPRPNVLNADVVSLYARRSGGEHSVNVAWRSTGSSKTRRTVS